MKRLNHLIKAQKMTRNLNHLNPEKRFFQSALLALGLWVWNGSATAPAATVNVSVGDDFFNPATVNISPGDTVDWVWVGAIIHSSTSDTGVWGSAIMASGSFPHTFPSAGSFPYHCSVHPLTMLGTVNVAAANVPPTVAITNPPNGAVLVAPATFSLGASASDSNGTVTNVQFFRGTVSLGKDTTRPYSLNVSNLAAGTYTFSAVAADNGGAKATNAISLTVVTPLPVTLSAPRRVSATSLQFTYSANVGLRYVVARSGDLTNWTGLSTNIATTNAVVFVDTAATGRAGFYRVGRLPNP